MPTTFHYPESPYVRTYADVITRISRMDSLPNYLSYGAPLARASRAQGASLLVIYRNRNQGDKSKVYVDDRLSANSFFLVGKSMSLCVLVFVLDGTLRNVFGHLWILSDPTKNLGTLKIKNVAPINVKKLAGIRIYILVRTEWLVLSEVYISLVVRIGLLCPNIVLTPVYEWICILQTYLIKLCRSSFAIV